MSVAEEFIYTTMGEIANIIGNMNKLKYENMNMYKNFLRIQVMSIAKNHNFTSKKNYSLENKFGEPINIDVIWKGKSGMTIASFIISEHYNEKVRQSLCICDAPYKFWIYLEDKDIHNIKEIVKTNNVHFIPMSKVPADILYYSS